MADKDVAPPRITSRKAPAGRKHTRKGQVGERSKTRLVMPGSDSVKDKQVRQCVSKTFRRTQSLQISDLRPGLRGRLSMEVCLVDAALGVVLLRVK